MGDTLMTVVAIFLAVLFMFIFPMLSVSERTDDMSQLAVDTAVTEFVDESRAQGKVTIASYEKLINTLNATGNTYDVEVEVKHIDENIGKKTAWTKHNVIGENTYYSVYTSQIIDELMKDGVYLMKEGDIISCSAKNNNETMSQTLRAVFYSTSTGNTYQISVQHSGVSLANGLGND